jgi:methylated-DNA-[protein]-cysteine S-methyltransferase
MNANTSQVWSDCVTPIGRLVLTANDVGIDGLHFPGRGPERIEANRCDERFDRAVAQLQEYFAGTRTRFDLALDLSAGTPFQQSVWRELRSIPHGETITYSRLAARLGRTDRVRAVGAAVGRTPIPVIIPCHRVIGSDGKLTGYLGGLQRKQSLLDLESAVRLGHPVPTTFTPRQLALL